ncbi:MAG: hypothetical protein DRP54_03125 [Spirochaetes bacterium]|nr:MAG: hypothetical protein DRP54_03125 [Spirochaetota bacterium]
MGNVERNNKGRMYFVDSTDLGACRDHNIHNHKLFNGFAGSGKTTVR